MEATFASGYICGYVDFEVWVYFKTRLKVPLTDISIKRAKAKSKAYKVSDVRGLFLWVTP